MLLVHRIADTIIQTGVGVLETAHNKYEIEMNERNSNKLACFIAGHHQIYIETETATDHAVLSASLGRSDNDLVFCSVLSVE